VISIGAQLTARYRYSGQLCSRAYILKVNGQAVAPSAVTRDGLPEPASSSAALDAGTASDGWYYDSAAQEVWVWFPLASSTSTAVALQ
jgi:hypothetical protein